MQCTTRHTRMAVSVALAVLLGAGIGQASAAAVAYVTSETNGVGVIDLDQMTLKKTIALGKDGPRGLSLTADGSKLLVANKTGDLSVIDTSTDKVITRVKIGKNPEFVRVHRGFAYVTYEPGESGPRRRRWRRIRALRVLRAQANRKASPKRRRAARRGREAATTTMTTRTARPPKWRSSI